MLETFGTYLEKIMKHNCLSQRELARRAEIDHVSLCRMLKPYYKFKPGKTIDRLVAGVGCAPDERVALYRLAGIVPPELVVAFTKSQAAALQLLKVANSL